MPDGATAISPAGEIRRVRSADGTNIAFIEWDGAAEAPAAFLVHASGFCKEIWAPVAAELVARGSKVRAVAIDQRVHGDSDTPDPPIRWVDFGDDIGAVTETIAGKVIGVGHSSGGAALAIAELARPGTFAGLVLVEPIIYPGPFRRSEVNPMSTAALRRRASFGSLAEARANFAGKSPFISWDPRALDAYVAGGLRPAKGGRWELKCEPQSEAEFYRGATEHPTWEHLGEINCPVRLVAGANSDSHQGEYLQRLAGRFSFGELVVVEGATHFVPMELPGLIADWISAAADGVAD